MGDHRQDLSENEQLQWRITLLMYKSLLFVPKFSNLSFIEARLDHIYSYLKSPKTFMNPISNKLLTNISLLETRRVLNTNIYSNRSIVINETHSIENRPSEMYRSSLKTQPQNWIVQEWLANQAMRKYMACSMRIMVSLMNNMDGNVNCVQQITSIQILNQAMGVNLVQVIIMLMMVNDWNVLILTQINISFSLVLNCIVQSL